MKLYLLTLIHNLINHLQQGSTEEKGGVVGHSLGIWREGKERNKKVVAADKAGKRL